MADRGLSDRCFYLRGHNGVREKRSSSISSISSNDHDVKNTGDIEPSMADLNKELSIIRQSRDQNRGCTCRPIKIDKLSVVKMKTELMENKGIMCTSAEVESLSKGN